jgi:hypothetical protein
MDRLAPKRSAIRPAARRRPRPDARKCGGEVSWRSLLTRARGHSKCSKNYTSCQCARRGRDVSFWRIATDADALAFASAFGALRKSANDRQEEARSRMTLNRHKQEHFAAAHSAPPSNDVLDCGLLTRATHETARIHHVAQRHGAGMAGRGTGAARGESAYRRHRSTA